MDTSTVALVVLGVLAAAGLLIVGVAVYVLVKHRVPLRGIVAAVGALVYLFSPVDAVPEAVLGPFGLIDDGGILLGAAVYVSRLAALRRSGALDPAIEAVRHHRRSRGRTRDGDRSGTRYELER